MIQLWSIFIYPSNQKCNPKRPTHNPFILIIISLPKPQRQITYRLRTAFDSQRLIIGEKVVLGFDTGMVNHGAGIGCEARHGAANVSVDLDDFFNRGGFKEDRGDPFFDA
jgi:hypothetical protein